MKWMPLEKYYNATDELAIPNTAVPCKVVAVTGHNGDWRAYRGAAYWSDETVAAHGDVIIREAAEGLFPTFRNIGLRYRG